MCASIPCHAQILSPHDTSIADLINSNLEPKAQYDPAAVRAHPRCVQPALSDGTPLGDHYIATGVPCVVRDAQAVAQRCNTACRAVAERLCRFYSDNTSAGGSRRVVYTAMHGVGYPWIKAAFQAFGLPPVVPVPEQVDPDPAFPTVYLPNPEEGKGALTLAMRTADAEVRHYTAALPLSPLVSCTSTWRDLLWCTCTGRGPDFRQRPRCRQACSGRAHR